MAHILKTKGIASIIIERTTGDLPLVKVNNGVDLYYGMGYCHALDRGMHMMIMKILGTGTASEHLSGDEETLEIDKFFRRMNWHNNLGEELQKLNKEEINLLDAYCDGANAAFAKKKPWELKWLLGFNDFKWEKEDVILLARMAGFLTLAQSQGEIERLFVQMVQKSVPKNLLQELFPDILGDYDEELIKKIRVTDKIVPDAVKWNVSAASFMASNNWVIAGQKTTSGNAILANDPHLEINRLPAVWYEMAFQVGDKFAYSATMPGLSSLLISRKNDLSWGATYTFMDATDSWIEQCKDGKYLKDEQWHSFHERKELIKRKKGKAVEVTYYENAHGALDGNPYEEGFYLSTKWSGEKSGAQSIRAGFQLWNAETVEEGMNIIGNLEASFSWVLADDKQNIGYQMSGLMPKRKEAISGFAPLVGWNSDNDWQGYHTPEDLPRSYNPSEGYIITANNNLNHLGKVHPINIPMGEYRADRIKDLLDANDNITIEDVKKMHFDTYSIQAELFMKIIRPLLPDSSNGKLLKEWDLSYEVDSKGAYLFEMLYRSLYHEVFGAALGGSLVNFLQNESGVFIDFYANFDQILLSEESAWFLGQNRDDIYKKVIDTVLKMAVKKWGDINYITLSNMLLGGKLPKIAGFDKGPFPLRGGRATIHQGQVYRSAGRDTSFAPSFRLITDMGERTVHSNLAGGVSDRRFSKHYCNDFENWMNGMYKKLDF
jgi:penicillin amidase